MASNDTTLTGIQKAAVLLISLGPELSSTVFKHLKEEEIEDLTLEIANTRSISPQVKEDVINEFYEICLAQQYIDEGGIKYAKELLENPLHPYAQDLCRSIPQVTDERGRKLTYIEGSVPDAYMIPKGCAFFDRCRKAQKGLCDEAVPPVTDLGGGHRVSCYRYDA